MAKPKPIKKTLPVPVATTSANKGLTVQRVADALKASRGIMKQAARLLEVEPAAISYWCRRHPQLKRLSDDLKASIDDAASDNIAEVITDPEADEFRKDDLSKWWLSHRPESGFRKPSPTTNIGITNTTVTIKLDPTLQRRKEEAKRKIYELKLQEAQRIGHDMGNGYDEEYSDE